jgi:hypothetical protein
MISVTPARFAAIVLSLTPPIGSTRPVMVISPVIATRCLIGRFNATESRELTMPMPALGPS